MKTTFSSLVCRNLAVLFVILSVLTSCGKDKKPEPDLATRVSGTYRYSELTYDGNTIPGEQTNLKGNIVVSVQTPSKVKMKLDIRLKANSAEFMVLEASDVELVQSESTVDLFYESERIGRITGNKMVINGVDEDDVSFTISAVK